MVISESSEMTIFLIIIHQVIFQKNHWFKIQKPILFKQRFMGLIIKNHFFSSLLIVKKHAYKQSIAARFSSNMLLSFIFL